MWTADLRALRNLTLHRDGRAALLATLVSLACIVLASMGVGSAVLLSNDVITMVRGDETGALLQWCFAMTLVAPIVLSLGFGSQMLSRDLYRSPELPFLLASPVGALPLVARAYARMMATWLLLALALGLPLVIGLVTRADASAVAVAAYPVAFLGLAAPGPAVLILLRVGQERWLSRPSVRRGMMVVQVATCFALAVAILSGIFEGDRAAAALADLLGARPELPAPLAAASALMAASGPEDAHRHLWSGVLWIVATVPFLFAAASIYRRSYEVHLVTVDRPTRFAARRIWPDAPFASFLRQGSLAITRERSSVVFHAFLAVVMVGLIHFDPDATTGSGPVPEPLRAGLDLLRTWHGLTVLIATVAFLGVVAGEQGQVALLTTAPFSRGVFLASRLVAVSVPFVFSLVVAVAAGSARAGVGPVAIGVVLLAAVPVLLVTIGIAGVFGTWPAAIRLHDSVRVAESLRATLPVIGIVAATSLCFYAAAEGRRVLEACYHGHGPLSFVSGASAAWILLAASFVVAVFVFAAAAAVARRNVEKIFGPQDG